MHTTKSDSHIISHDPATVNVEKPTPSNPKKPPMMVLAGIGLILILGGLVLLYFNKDRFLPQTEEAAVTPPSFDESPLMTVGAETIYKKDLEYKLSAYPESMRASLTEGFKQQLIDESVTLQAGSEANFVDLSEEVFNNLYKDYAKREELVNQVKGSVQGDASGVKGSYVTIWFMNTKPGPMGYEAGQQFALEKITALHQAVSSGQMTTQQAGEAIQRDSSLAQVDSQYKSNAYTEFDTKERSQRVTAFPNFDEQLLALEPGEVTAIVVGQDRENNNFNAPEKDAVYLFGQVTEKKSDGGQSFDQWLRTQKESYEVTNQ